MKPIGTTRDLVPSAAGASCLGPCAHRPVGSLLFPQAAMAASTQARRLVGALGRPAGTFRCVTLGESTPGRGASTGGEVGQVRGCLVLGDGWRGPSWLDGRGDACHIVQRACLRSAVPAPPRGRERWSERRTDQHRVRPTRKGLRDVAAPADSSGDVLQQDQPEDELLGTPPSRSPGGARACLDGCPRAVTVGGSVGAGQDLRCSSQASPRFRPVRRAARPGWPGCRPAGRPPPRCRRRRRPCRTPAFRRSSARRWSTRSDGARG
jgi:hypothetical protein